jgi:hypothetical protein
MRSLALAMKQEPSSAIQGRLTPKLAKITPSKGQAAKRLPGPFSFVVRKIGIKYPQYLGWTTWMDARPGESAVQTVNRQIIWDGLVEGEIFFNETIENERPLRPLWI